MGFAAKYWNNNEQSSHSLIGNEFCLNTLCKYQSYLINNNIGIGIIDMTTFGYEKEMLDQMKCILLCYPAEGCFKT
jgi:hypothetical protein